MKKLLACLLLAFALPALAAQAPRKVAEVEGVSEYRLANGLRVLLAPDQSADTVTVHVTYLVGSRHEGYGEKGMAHLLEHLLFKGSKRHPDVKQEFARRGARWNGTTSFDRTNYFETLPASSDNLSWALAMEADRMVNAFIRKADLASEMTVVRNEFEMGENSAGSVLLQRMQRLAFGWHNYGNAIIGARSDIEDVPLGRLRASTARGTSPTTRCWSSAGASNRRARWRWSSGISARCRARSARCPRCIPSSRRRTASAR
jgi:predicted Zn-dependent peptidase